MRTVTVEPANDPVKPSRFGFAGATLLVLVPGSTLAQLIAAICFGMVEHFRWDQASTGGALALVSSLVLGAACRSWHSWRKLIWMPIGILVVAAFVVAGGYAQEVARREEAVFEQERQDQIERDRRAEADRACLELRQQIDDQEAEVNHLHLLQDPANRPSWIDEPLSWQVSGAENTLNQLVASYNTTC